MNFYDVKINIESFGSYINDINLEIEAVDEEEAERIAIEEVKNNLLIYIDYIEIKE